MNLADEGAAATCSVSGLICRETSFASALHRWPNRLARIASARLDCKAIYSALNATINDVSDFRDYFIRLFA